MAYSAIVGSFNIDPTKLATETQAITGLGFQPKIVLFWWGGSTATIDTVAGGTINVGFGAAISSTSRFCVQNISIDAGASSDSQFSQNITEIMRAYTDVTTLDGILDFSSMDADGFTVIYDDAFTQAYRISYLALGGTDLTNVFIGNKITPSSTGNYSTTGVGFQPDALIAVMTNSTSTSSTGLALWFNLGMATGSSAQGVVYGESGDALATSDTKGYGYNGEVISNRQSTIRNSFVSFDADGFTLNALEASAQRYFNFICLKGGQYSAGDITTRTDGNDIAETVGFTPVALLFASANRALSTQDTLTDHNSISIGAGTSTTNRACAAIWDQDALADTETAFANYDTAVYANVADDAIAGLMDIKSIDASGFTCVMDDTDPTACWVTYLAIGAVVAAGQPMNARGVRVPGMRQWQPGRQPGF